MTNTLETMYAIQSKLSIAQATPILGPLFVSPIKALVSLVQIVAGIASSILFGIGGAVAYLFRSDALFFNLADHSLKPLLHAGYGFLHLVYSGANFITVGLLGYRFVHIYGIKV